MDVTTTISVQVGTYTQMDGQNSSSWVSQFIQYVLMFRLYPNDIMFIYFKYIDPFS
jgi:hypothetical protein